MTSRNDPRLRQLAEVARASAPTHRAPARKPVPKPTSTPRLAVVPEYASACSECLGVIVEQALGWHCMGCCESGDYIRFEHGGKQLRAFAVTKRGRRA